MTAEERAYRGFACPHEPFDAAFLDTVAVEYARGYTRLLLDRYGADLTHSGGTLASFLVDWLERDATFESVWDPSFGDVRRAVLSGTSADYRAAAAAWALRLHACGHSGAWELALPAATSLRVGRWRLPVADRLAVSAGEDGCVVSLRHRGKQTEITLRGTLNQCASEATEALPQVGLSTHSLVLIAPDFPEVDEFAEDRSRIADVAATETAAAACAQAVRLLRDHAPQYLGWVDRVVRGVVPLRSAGTTIFSSSAEGRPGVVGVSFPSEPAAVAEMLVHEGTHQYLHLLCRAGAIDDGSDPTLYYSPVKRQGRPVRALVLAYHAFANVLLFYRLCRSSGLADDGYCRRNEEELVPQLEVLASGLRASRAITPLGRALWEPLAERIH